MSSQIGIHQLSKSFGTRILFSKLSFTIHEGDRIGLLGPNGCGKSTLLKILMDLEASDEGHISKRQGLRIGYASQVPEFPDQELEEVLMNAVKGDEHEKRTKANILLGKAQFIDIKQKASGLSGGWKKRLDICRALMHEPDILLLDEPTNHLDLEGILWLEKFLNREKISYLIVSHDRYFLENVTNKIIEINRCYPQGIFISEGNLSTYLERKVAFMEAQAQYERGLASVVRDEIDWLRRSPKARTTKSRSRIQKAGELIEELSDVKQRNKVVKVNLDFTASERDTRKLLVAKNLCKKIGDKELFKGIDLQLSPGTRLGIVGKNGTGKTTLLKILAKEVPHDEGTLKYADDLKLVYFDQHREHLAPNLTIRQALAPTNDMVNYRGQLIHVNGWAKKFLFSTDRMELPISCLSGGERARILIAKLMLQPADILFLDEPTNDLDIQTLEVIEESLKEFVGAVVLISHDRCLMDRLCTQILGLGRGNEQQFYADYSQWESSYQEEINIKKEPIAKTTSPVSTPKKLSYNEQRELANMEKVISECEAQIVKLQKLIETSDPSKSQDVYHKLAEAEQNLETHFQRWQYLENRSNSA